jgi:hypothetical protein
MWAGVSGRSSAASPVKSFAKRAQRSMTATLARRNKNANYDIQLIPHNQVYKTVN